MINTRRSGTLHGSGVKKGLMTHSLRILIPCLVISVQGCDSSPGFDPDESVLLPLKVGNYWAYSSWYIDPSFSDSFTVRITQEIPVTYHGETLQAFGQVVSSEASPPGYEWLFSNEPGGLYILGGLSKTDTLITKVLQQKYPAAVGESWESVRLTYRPYESEEFAVKDTVEMSVVAIDTEITTPAGTFTCYVYKYSFRPSDDVFSYWNVYEYYAPGIGLVAEIIKSQAPGRPEEAESKQESVLYDYQIR